MVSFNPGGLGASFNAEQMKGKDSSNFKHVNRMFNDFGLNYAYLITHRLQLGGFFSISEQKYVFEPKNGSTATNRVTETTIGIFALYNFRDELEKSYYLGLSLANFNIEEQNAHSFTIAETKNPFELDDAGQSLQLMFGKRFALISEKNKHLSYAPELTVFYRTHSKDFKDQKIRHGFGAGLHLLKFDFLF